MPTKDFSDVAFDYLIVGGGVAGLTLAARLTEDENIHVGVVEAGRHIKDMPQINIPGYIGRAIGDPNVDWMLMSEPQKSLHGRPVFQPRGRVLGGSSALNFMQLSRASIDEYNSFEALGNEGWNWSEFLKYFRKTEGLVPPSPEDARKYNIQLREEYHGLDGPMPKSYPLWYPELHDPFLGSLRELGVPINPDPSTGDNVGAFTGAYSLDPTKATRAYSTTIFYEPNADRPNLHLVTDAQATKILTEVHADGVIGTGVEFVKGGNTHVAKASCEVILSAGSFQSPQLLELSGIGSSAVLKEFGIDTVLDLPSVGQNLQDHPSVVATRKVKSNTQTLDIMNDPKVIEEQIMLHETQQMGMLSSVHAGFAMIPLEKLVEPSRQRRFMEKIKVETPLMIAGSKEQVKLQQKWLNDPSKAQLELINIPSWLPIGQPGEFTADPGTRYQTILAILLHPFSTGSVHIKSADPLAHPAIDPGYLSQSVDLDLLVDSVKFIRKLMTSGPLAEYHQEFYQPGPDVKTDDEIKEWVKKYVSSTWHPIGTASMLPKDDGGVVNKNLLVYGTTNIRVVDASVIPFQLSCHIQATIYAIAEKAADVIKTQRMLK